MQTALHLKTTVLPGGKIELSNPRLPYGELVDIFVILPELPATPVSSALDILAQVPGQRLFKTAAEVDAYLQEERTAWER